MVAASLARLRELALSLPRPGCEWEARPTFELPSSEEAVAVFERAAGFPLSADFRAFLALTGSVVGMSVHNGYWIGGVERLIRCIGREEFPREVAGDLAIPIATDGGGNGFLLSSGGLVWRWDHETGAVLQVATSFADFLARVVDDWEAYVADSPGWRYLV